MLPPRHSLLLLALLALLTPPALAGGGAPSPDATAERWWQTLGPTFLEGADLYRRGAYAAAASRFGQAIPAAPYACFFNRALCHYRRGQWALACADFAGAAEVARDRDQRRRALVALGAAWLRRNDPDRALTALRSAEALGADDALLQLNLSAALEALERHDAALEALRQARALGESRPIRQALLTHRLGKGGALLGIDAARATAADVDALGRVLALRPQHAAAREQLTTIAHRARTAGATELAERASRLLARAGKTPRPGPPAELHDTLVDGEPERRDVPRWQDYTRRWELLVLLSVVLAILLTYLRLTRRRQSGPDPEAVVAAASDASRRLRKATAIR